MLSRELFIRRALVEGGWDRRKGDHLFMEENRRQREEAETVEHRARRRGIVADDHAVFAFYDERIPGRRRLRRALRPLVETGAPGTA